MRKILLWSLGLVMGISGGMMAFAANTGSPEKVVLEYFTAMKKEELPRLAGFMHPEELAKFKLMFLPIFQLSAQSDKGGGILKQFGQGDSLDAIREYPPDKFFTRFITWMEKVQPNLNDAVKNSAVETVGHVVEGDSCHVLVRMSYSSGGMTIRKMSVVTVVPWHGEWKMMLTAEIQGLATNLKQHFSAPKKKDE